MKTKFFFPIAALAAMASLTGCDENSWNDEHLDGFDSNITTTQKENREMTLSAAQYKLIASNSTNKSMAEEAGAADELAAVGSRAAFNEKINPRDYIPAFLNSTDNPYFTLTDGSAISVTYNVEVGQPECVYAAANASEYTVTTSDYQHFVWDSDDNFIDAFAPSHPASKYLQSVVADFYDDAEEGQYAYVTYNESSQEPVFGNVGGGDTPQPEVFEMSSVVGSIVPDVDVEIFGVVSGACTSGFTLTDKTGTIFVYMGSGFDPATYPVGTQLKLNGTSTSFKNTNLQIAMGAEIEVMGSQDYTYPAPVVYDAAALDAVLSRPANQLAVYARITGTVAISGQNINIVLSEDATAKGSVYYATDAQKEALTDGSTVTITGWFISISGSKYCNFIINTIEQGAKSANRRFTVKAPAVEVPFETLNSVWYFNGSKWNLATDFVALNPADYTAMGARSDLNAANAKAKLPKFLASKFPYAAAGDTKYVVYKLYANSTTSLTCDKYDFNGSEWVLYSGVETETSQFVRANGKWIYNPDVEITLPAGKGQSFSATYYQACVDWVYENICVPLGDTSIKSGKFYVTSYGNNEYWTGTSAYQNNVDLRAGSARAQYPEGWEGYTDEQIVETEKTRFCTILLPAVLAKFHPEAAPIPGVELHYIINFSAYDGSTTTAYTATYLVTDKATFEFQNCTWWPDGKPAE